MNTNSDSDSSHSDSSKSESIADVVELVLHQLQLGQKVDFDEINRQHDELQPELRSRLKVLSQVFRLGREPSLEETADSSPDRMVGELLKKLDCPHCGVGIKIVDQHEQVTCRNCGSSIQVSRSNQSQTGGSLTLQRQLQSLGRFELRDVLGRGGFGVVYRAFDSELKREVAIKLPRDGTFISDSDEQRFLREARHVAQLSHPNIVPVYEVGQDTETPYIVSEFIDGLTLSDLISERRLDSMESADMMAQIADAVAYAHQQKIIHRDLKPGNILLNHSLTPFVTDFGLARAEEGGEFTITEEGQVIGTPSYMSPEQISGKSDKISPLTDVYSLGVVFYRMLTGELPFRGSKKLMLHQIQFEDPRSPRTLNEKIPRDLETIALKAMSKEPAKRYDSAEAMATDLRNAVAGRPINARPVSRFEKFVRLCRRHPVSASLAGLACLLLLVTAIGGIVWGIREGGLRDAAELRAVAEADKSTKGVIGRASEFLKTGDNLESLPLLASANDSLANFFPDRMDTNRFRIGTILASSPGLISIQTDSNPVHLAGFSPNNKFAAASFNNGRLIVWDIASDNIVIDNNDQADVFKFCFSPNNRFIAVATDGHLIKVWDILSKQLVGSSNRHTDYINRIVFDESSSQVLSGSNDNTARLWKFESSNDDLVFQHTDPVKNVSFVPETDRFISVESMIVNRPSRLNLWNSTEPDQPLTTTDTPTMIFQPQWLGKRLQGRTSAGQVFVWEFENDKLNLLREFTPRPRLVAAAFLQTNDLVLLASEQGEIERLSIQSGEVEDAFETGRTVAGITLDPACQQLCVRGNGNQLHIWDLELQEIVLTPLAHASQVKIARFSNNSRYLLTSANDGIVKVWDLQAGEKASWQIEGNLKTTRPDKQNFIGAISDCGEWLAVSNRDQQTSFSLYRTESESSVFEIELPSACGIILFSPDSSEVAVTCEDEILRIYSTQNGRLLSDEIKVDDQFGMLAYTPDGKKIVGANLKMIGLGIDDSIALYWWDRASGEKSKPMLHDNFVRDIRINRDGTLAATNCMDKSVQVWDLNTAEAVSPSLNFQKGYCQDFEFNPTKDALVTAFGTIKEVTNWDYRNGNPRFQPLRFQALPVWLDFHPDGNTLAIATKGDGTVRFLNDQSLRPDTIRLQGTAPDYLRFNEQGTVLATVSKSPLTASERFSHGVAQLWDSQTLEMLGPIFTTPRPLAKTFLDPKTRFVAMTDHTGTVTVHKLVKDTRSLQTINDLVDVLSGHRVGANWNLVPLSSDQFNEVWQRVKNQHPETKTDSYAPQ